MPEKEHKRAHKKRQKQDLLNKGSLFDRLSCSCLPYLRVLVSLYYTFKEILSTENWKFYALKSKNRSIPKFQVEVSHPKEIHLATCSP
ncbi:TPA: hypothetical protein ACL8BV_000561, partial [Streptococcus pneumoniae]